MKKRKPRGIKLSGQYSEDMCICLRFGCDPDGLSQKLKRKFDKRISEGRCHSCGNIKCSCKTQSVKQR